MLKIKRLRFEIIEENKSKGINIQDYLPLKNQGNSIRLKFVRTLSTQLKYKMNLSEDLNKEELFNLNLPIFKDKVAEQERISKFEFN